MIPANHQLPVETASSAATVLPAPAAATTATVAAMPVRAAPVGPSPGGSVAAMAGSLMLVIALIVALGWLLRRVQGLRMQGGVQLQVLGGANVGAKERVLVLQAGDSQFLLGVAPGSVQLLHKFAEGELPPAPPAPTLPPIASAFAEKLRQSLGQGGPK